MINNVHRSRLLPDASRLRRFAESDPEDVSREIQYKNDWWNGADHQSPKWNNQREFDDMIRFHVLQLEAERSHKVCLIFSAVV